MNFGDILHVTNKAVSKWERGESIPDIEVLKDISEHFEITIEELLNGERSQDTKPTKLDEEQIKYFIKESNSKKSPTKKTIEVFAWIWVIFVFSSIILGVLVFFHRNDRQYYGKISQITENQYALVPDRMVYKDDSGEYFIFGESDSDFNKIYNTISSKLKYKNDGSTLSLSEIEDLKEQYSFIEFDYNTKSKNRIFLLDCPNIAMINMTGEEGKIAREKIDNIDEIKKVLNSATAFKEKFTVKYDLEYDILIDTLPKDMSGFKEKTDGVSYKVVDYNELKELTEKYAIEINIDNIDFNARNFIVTFYNREYISRVDKCIGHLSYYFSSSYGTSHLNLQIVSKIYNANCIYFYSDSNLLPSFASNYTNGPIDITEKIVTGSFYERGTVLEISDDNIIKIQTKNNHYYLLSNSENLKFIDGRTLENIKFQDIKVGYYIDFYRDGEIYVYKNITGDELKKELLQNLSFDYQDGRWSYPAIGLISVQKTGENEGIITIEIDDFVTSNGFYNGTDEIFYVEVKITPDTVYHSKGGNIYNIDTLKYAIGNINDLRLDKNTIDDEYPVVIEFNSTDT